ncbi:MAG: serine hydrolase [Candidatus Komeilibacteria bacterium]|nr:serine hydrolase [Candidatus Komeilibacteria bacterium]
MFWNFLLNIAVLWQVVSPTTVLPAQTINLAPDNSRVDFLAGRVSVAAPYLLNKDSLGVAVSAKAAAVVDVQTQAVLWQKNIEAVLPIASLTKLMTVLTWRDYNVPLDKTMIVSAEDYREGGRAYIYRGEEIAVEDLLASVLIASDNTAAVVLARSTGLNEPQFVAAMNAKAAAIGLRQSVFVEPTGLSGLNKASVADLILLSEMVFADEQLASYLNRVSHSYRILNNNRLNSFASTNALLNSYLSVVAGKTGYSEEAGGCLSVRVKVGGRELQVILLGSEDQYTRFQEAKSLAQWVYDNYEWPSQQ